MTDNELILKALYSALEDSYSPANKRKYKRLFNKIDSGKLVLSSKGCDGLREALQKIEAIEDKMEGGDWDEIEEAREIARKALARA